MHFKVLLAVTLVLLLCVYFLSLAYKQNRNIANIIETFEPLKRDGPASTRELIDVRNEMSRLLNRKQQELAKLQCEVKFVSVCDAKDKRDSYHIIANPPGRV